MDRDVVEQVLEIICEMSGKERNDTLDFVWTAGLEDRTDDEIKLALKYYCQFNEYNSMPTPAKLMSFLKYDDPHGHKAAQKRREETQELIKRIGNDSGA